MMKKVYLLSMLVSFFSFSQVKNNWLFGAEIGNNTIISYKLNEPKNSLQGGVLAEYYFDEMFSVSARVKYFKTGVSFSNGYNPTIGHFDGSVVSIPINANANFNFGTKFYPSIKLGLAWNNEIESNYTYTNTYSKTFISLNMGLGFNYKITKNLIIYSNLEGFFFGGFKGSSDRFIFKKNYYTQNAIINFGLKRIVFN